MDHVRPPSQGFTGTVNLQLTDLIQMVCLSRSDLIIRVHSSEGSGTIYVKEGQVYHAQTENLQGEEAFFEMLRWEDGQFEMLPFQDVASHSVNKPWEHLLVEAMRMRDEKEEASESPIHTELDENIDKVFDELEENVPQVVNMDEDAVEEPEAPPRSIKVLVIDDSTFFARQLKRMLEAESNIEVVAVAQNGKEALEFLAPRPPIDLITLDIQMPVMQGDTTLKHIMIRSPIPALIISSFQPQSLREVFEFLQLGAVDFISKPAAGEDIKVYGGHLRDMARKAAQAKISHFRRWRKPKSDSSVPLNSVLPQDRILVILGAEGAYIDWFRLPLSQLKQKGLVIGLQKLSDPFLEGFCKLLEEEAKLNAIPLLSSRKLTPGIFYLGNAGRQVSLELNQEISLSFDVQILSSEPLPWNEGIYLWLTQLAEQAREKMSVYLLSAAHALSSDFIQALLKLGVQFILSPRESVLCTQLVDSVNTHAPTYPLQIRWGHPETLTEVWLGK